MNQNSSPLYEKSRGRSGSPRRRSRSPRSRSRSRSPPPRDSYKSSRRREPSYSPPPARGRYGSRSPPPSYSRSSRRSPSPRYRRHSPYRGGASHGSRYYDPRIDNLRHNPPENKVLAVFGLDRDCEEGDLMKLFKKYGANDCKMIIDKRVHKCFIF
jgi:hypothetical protein